MLLSLRGHKRRILWASTLMVGIACYISLEQRTAFAQNSPLLSGGAAFLTSTNGGKTTYLPLIEPLIALPIGGHILVESRAALLESFSPRSGQGGYDHTHFAGFTYAQADLLLSRHITAVAGN